MAQKKDSKSRASAPGRKQTRSKAAAGAAQDVARTSARSTVSGPAVRNGFQDVTDSATAKLAGTEAVSAAMPFNAAKPSEYGDASSDPAVGQSGRYFPRNLLVYATAALFEFDSHYELFQRLQLAKANEQERIRLRYGAERAKPKEKDVWKIWCPELCFDIEAAGLAS